MQYCTNFQVLDSDLAVGARFLGRERDCRRQVRLPGYVLSLIIRANCDDARQRDCPRVEIYILARRRSVRVASGSRLERAFDIIAVTRPDSRNSACLTFEATTFCETRR